MGKITAHIFKDFLSAHPFNVGVREAELQESATQKCKIWISHNQLYMFTLCRNLLGGDDVCTRFVHENVFHTSQEKCTMW